MHLYSRVAAFSDSQEHMEALVAAGALDALAGVFTSEEIVTHMRVLKTLAQIVVLYAAVDKFGPEMGEKGFANALARRIGTQKKKIASLLEAGGIGEPMGAEANEKLGQQVDLLLFWLIALRSLSKVEANRDMVAEVPLFTTLLDALKLVESSTSSRVRELQHATYALVVALLEAEPVRQDFCRAESELLIKWLFRFSACEDAKSLYLIARALYLLSEVRVNLLPLVDNYGVQVLVDKLNGPLSEQVHSQAQSMSDSNPLVLGFALIAGVLMNLSRHSEGLVAMLKWHADQVLVGRAEEKTATEREVKEDWKKAAEKAKKEADKKAGIVGLDDDSDDDEEAVKAREEREAQEKERARMAKEAAPQPGLWALCPSNKITRSRDDSVRARL